MNTLSEAKLPQRKTIVWISAILFVLVFSAGDYLLNINPYVKHVWADTLWTLAAFGAALKSYLLLPYLEGHLRRAWLFIGHACLSWFIGMLIWSYLELVVQVQTPFPAWSDLGFLAFAPLFMMGLISLNSVLPGIPFTVLQTSRLGIIIGCIIIIHVLIYDESLKSLQHSAIYLIAALAYPVLYMSLFVQSILNASLYVWGNLRYIALMLSLSIAVMAITNTFYALALLGESYAVGNILDIFWIIGFVLIYLAAEHQKQSTSLTPDEDFTKSEETRAGLAKPDDIIEPVFLALTILAIYYYRDNLEGIIVGVVLAVGFGVLLLFSIREIARRKIETSLIEKVRDSEKDLRRIINDMQDTYYRTDKNGLVTQLSPSISDLLGFMPEELIGTKLSDRYDDPNGREKFLQEITAKNGVVRNYQAALKRKDGSVVWVSTNARLLKDNAGELTGVEGITRDISDIKQAHQNLETRVAERTVELENAKKDAEKASAAKSDFLSKMSHELRTPMNAILGFAQLLDMDSEYLNADRKENIREILNSGYHLLELINDVLDLSRIESGGIAVNIKDTDISGVILDSISMAQAMADKYSITIEYSADQAQQQIVRCDPIRLRQALINLITNGIKYNKENGRVSLSTEMIDENTLRLNIVDTGIGIPDEQIGQLFVPFERLGAEMTGVEGTGIGLTISRRLMQLMDGELGLASTSEDGSHFYIDIPRAK